MKLAGLLPKQETTLEEEKLIHSLFVSETEEELLREFEGESDEEIKQETIEEVAERLYPDSNIQKRIFIKGTKYQQEQDKHKYSKVDMIEFANWCRIQDNKYPNRVITIQQLFEQFKK